MEQAVLRKLQLTQLEIAKEIKRVCEENHIRYFLCCGSFLGAVRHQGFIPWDDDFDIGMLRQDYERFCRIAPEKLGSGYCLQNWHTDPRYSLPFAKVRKKGTLLLEEKSIHLEENGIYIDVFPFDYAPESQQEQQKLAKAQVNLFRMKLMKSGMRPWMDKGKIVWVKRLGFLAYQFSALWFTQEKLIQRFEENARSVPESPILCRQRAWTKLDCYQRDWCENLKAYAFEGEYFPGPADYDGFLRAIYGDYMQLPPEDSRADRHQIIRLSFGDGSQDWERK